MSTTISLGSFKSEADMRKQLKIYSDQLKRNIKLEDEYEDAALETLRNEKLGIKPIAPVGETTQMTYKQKSDQIELFIKYASSVMGEDEAKRYATIVDPQMLKVVNMNWSKIENALMDYKEETGEEINADCLNAFINREFSDPKSEISKLKYQLPPSVSSGPLILGQQTAIPETLLQTLKTSDSLSVDELHQVLRGYLKDTYPDVWGSLLKDTFSRKNENKIIRKYVDLEVIEPTKTLKKGDILNIIRFESAKKSPDKIKNVTIPDARSIRAPIRFMRTTGGRIYYGRGVDTNSNAKYAQFGRYYVHIPSLRNNTLNFKYKSLATVETIPKQIISDLFKDFMLALLETGNINNSMFLRLTPDERSAFYYICRKAETDEALGIDDLTTDDERKEMDDFLLLKAQIMSGNNNDEVIKRLRSYVLKFMKEQRITRKAGMEILSEIAILV